VAHKFKIETNTPIPENHLHVRRRASNINNGLMDAFRGLQVGECIFIELKRVEDHSKAQVQLCAYAGRLRREKKSRKFTSRRMSDGVRIWRIK